MSLAEQVWETYPSLLVRAGNVREPESPKRGDAARPPGIRRLHPHPPQVQGHVRGQNPSRPWPRWLTAVHQELLDPSNLLAPFGPLHSVGVCHKRLSAAPQAWLIRTATQCVPGIWPRSVIGQGDPTIRGHVNVQIARQACVPSTAVSTSHTTRACLEGAAAEAFVDRRKLKVELVSQAIPSSAVTLTVSCLFPQEPADPDMSAACHGVPAAFHLVSSGAILCTS